MVVKSSRELGDKPPRETMGFVVREGIFQRGHQMNALAASQLGPGTVACGLHHLAHAESRIVVMYQ
jgi:hypothetical protein